ncbi:hypothetical protein B0H21DRAFT_711901 [Amylocystis lapponica]|nr:hypothetical protein B0H21DRAFT_711901 [Amylocystis lapponica]
MSKGDCCIKQPIELEAWVRCADQMSPGLPNVMRIDHYTYMPHSNSAIFLCLRGGTVLHLGSANGPTTDLLSGYQFGRGHSFAITSSVRLNEAREVMDHGPCRPRAGVLPSTQISQNASNCYIGSYEVDLAKMFVSYANIINVLVEKSPAWRALLKTLVTAANSGRTTDRRTKNLFKILTSQLAFSTVPCPVHPKTQPMIPGRRSCMTQSLHLHAPGPNSCETKVFSVESGSFHLGVNEGWRSFRRR